MEEMEGMYSEDVRSTAAIGLALGLAGGILTRKLIKIKIIDTWLFFIECLVNWDLINVSFGEEMSALVSNIIY